MYADGVEGNLAEGCHAVNIVTSDAAVSPPASRRRASTPSSSRRSTTRSTTSRPPACCAFPTRPPSPSPRRRVPRHYDSCPPPPPPPAAVCRLHARCGPPARVYYRCFRAECRCRASPAPRLRHATELRSEGSAIRRVGLINCRRTSAMKAHGTAGRRWGTQLPGAECADAVDHGRGRLASSWPDGAKDVAGSAAIDLVGAGGHRRHAPTTPAVCGRPMTVGPGRCGWAAVLAEGHVFGGAHLDRSRGGARAAGGVARALPRLHRVRSANDHAPPGPVEVRVLTLGPVAPLQGARLVDGR